MIKRVYIFIINAPKFDADIVELKIINREVIQLSKPALSVALIIGS